ncbi:MAG: glycosyltransferase, partial [Acidimicrobiia bacterium]
EEKRPLLWVEAAARVSKRRPDAHFVVFGTGPLRTEMEHLARKYDLEARLHLPGTTDNAPLAISSMDVFMLTSMFEGTPNVVLEAQLLGVPVVATEAGGTREAIDVNVTGWIVTGARPEALAERVLSVLDDPSWRVRASRAGPEFVAARFGLERMVEETLALYGTLESCADRAKPRDATTAL